MAFSAGLVQSVDAGANIVAISEAWANLEPEPEVYDVISRIAGRIVAVDIEDADKQKLLDAMEGHILAQAELMGLFTKP